jgi:type I restriction enzyme S subunit
MSFPRYPAYKDSSVEWLGEVPEHWEVGQSRRRFALRNERALDGEEQLTASQKHGIIRQADFVESEGRRVVEVIKGADILKHVEAGDFVISMRSFQGGIEYSPYCGSISSAYVMLKPIKDVHPGFFRWLLKSDRYIQALQSTSNLVRDGQALRFSNFAQVDIPVVPLSEQASIATFLDRETAKIDALIAEQQRLIELLQEKRQAVISHAVTKGLNPDAPMKDSGVDWLGEVPEHWEVRKLSQLCDGIGSGTTPKSDVPEFYEEEGLPWIVTGDLKDCLLETCSNHITVKAMAEHSALKLYDIGSVVVAMYGATIGKAAILGMRATVNQACCVLPPGDQVLGGFLLLFVLAARVHLISLATGGGQPNINQEVVRSLRIPLPPVADQQEIIQRVGASLETLDSVASFAALQVEILQERRSALISAAVTGQIDVRGLVPEAEAA